MDFIQRELWSIKNMFAEIISIFLCPVSLPCRIVWYGAVPVPPTKVPGTVRYSSSIANNTYPALDLDWIINYELPHVLDLGALLADESPALAGRHQEAQLQVHVAFRGSRPAR